MADWKMKAYEGFAIGSETIELSDEKNDGVDITDFGIAMFISGIDEPLTIGTGNFAIVPPVSPAPFPTIWEFSMSADAVSALDVGETTFDTVISDGGNALIGIIHGVIDKVK